MKQKLKLKGEGVEALRTQVSLLSPITWNVKEPLPPIRGLAAAFNISQSAVYRLLQALAFEGKLVAHEINGRFYLKEGEAFASTNLPVVCFFRNMENWFFAARKLLIGISQECEVLGRGVLLFRHEHLIHHHDVAYPPQFGALQDQIETLDSFFKTQRGNYSALLFEDLWLDEALLPFESELSKAIVIGRETTLPSLKSLRIDSKVSACTILAHLHGRGFQRIVIAIPFYGNKEIERQMNEIQEASLALGIPFSKDHFYPATTPEERERMIQKLKKSSDRVAIFCPEDNVSALIDQEMQRQGIESPLKIGLLSGMGEASVQKLQISSIQIDYTSMGRRAVAKLFEKSSVPQERMLPLFFQGRTT